MSGYCDGENNNYEDDEKLSREDLIERLVKAGREIEDLKSASYEQLCQWNCEEVLPEEIEDYEEFIEDYEAEEAPDCEEDDSDEDLEEDDGWDPAMSVS